MKTVRPATLDDVPALVALMTTFYAESDFPLDDAWATASFAALLAQPALGGVWVAERDGVIAGHVVLTVRFAMEFGGLDGFVDDLYVKPEHRRQGLSRALLDALVAACRLRALRALHVEVAPDNTAANRVYEAIGLGLPTDVRQKRTLVFGDVG